MSDENKKSAEEIVAEMQELMKRQMELQAELLGSNWNGFNDALGAFMGMFNNLAQANKQEETKSDKKDES